jgi:RND superfamily putative drug exporter
MIMMAAFLALVAYPVPVVKMVGLGLVVAVFVDATVVRMLLVPSLMVLMGEANWWIPGWLDRVLPTIHLDESNDGSPSAADWPVPVRLRGATTTSSRPIPLTRPPTGAPRSPSAGRGVSQLLWLIGARPGR